MSACLHVPLSFYQYSSPYNFGILPNYKDALLVHKQQIKATSKTKDMCRNIHYTFFFFFKCLHLLSTIHFPDLFSVKEGNQSKLACVKLTIIFSWEWNLFFFDFLLSVRPAWRLKISSKRTLVFAFASLSTAKTNLEYDSLAQ